MTEFAIKAFLICITVTWLAMLWGAHKDPALKNFSLLGYFTTREGYPDRAAAGETTALIFMSAWGTVMVLRNQMSEWFIGAYVVSFVVRGGYAAWLKATKPALGTTVTEESSASSKTTTTPAEAKTS